MSRPTTISIDLDALRANCALVRSSAPDSQIVAVVKADAYGHGAELVAHALSDAVEMFAVSSLDEAEVLREAGIRHPVLLLEGCFELDEYARASELNLEVVIHNFEQVAMLRESSFTTPVVVWLKMDSGMHRLGLNQDAFVNAFEALASEPRVKDFVMCTHLACADSVEQDTTLMQLERFEQACQALPKPAQSKLCSTANSAGLMAWPQSRMDLVRPGIMLYGLSPFDAPNPIADQLRPVMRFESQVIAVRDIAAGESVGYGHVWTASSPAKIATIAAGYGDGYPRNAQSGTPVMVNGQRAALVGRVSMDMITVDVSGIEPVRVGDPVQLWGEQLSANEVAARAGTIGYELVTRMPKRTQRILQGKG